MFFKVIAFLFILGICTACRREPSVYHSKADKSPGDNGVQIKISENPKSYIPGKLYAHENYPPEDDYSDNAIDHLLRTAQKRACIRRGGNCDHRPNDCCYNSSCRCNLWGSNCRCQRMGIFQKWGK